MSAITATQKLALTEDFSGYPESKLLGGATDGDPDLNTAVTGRPAFTGTSDAVVVAADTVVFAFPALTVAGLNLAAGESRVIKGRVQSGGAAITACSYFETAVIAMNVGGTLTLNAAAGLANVTTPVGVITVTVLWAVASNALQLTVTSPATITTANYRCDLFWNTPKIK